MSRFKVDENLPPEVAALLRAAGHEAATVVEQCLRGKPDATVAAVCSEEGLALVSLDLHFSNIRAYPPQDYAGLVVLRIPSQDTARVLAALDRALPRLTEEPLEGRLWIVEEDKLRVWKASE